MVTGIRNSTQEDEKGTHWSVAKAKLRECPRVKAVINHNKGFHCFQQ